MRLPFLSARPPRVTRYQIASPRWTAPPLTLALLSDLHINQPWTSLSYLDRIVDQTNQLGADAILLLGDYVMDRNMRKLGAHCPDWSQIIRRLTQLEAPLGVHGILGNHDWKPFPPPSDGSPRRNLIAEAFAEQGLALLQNQSQRLDHGPDGIWLVGLDSQRSHKIKKPRLIRCLLRPDVVW
ncbi:MAG: metallophosphoesterase, partial [Mangrovicoccus sp.]